MFCNVILLIFFEISLVANPYGNELQLFFPNSDGLDFLSVESGATLKRRQLNLGLFVDRSTNTLPRRVTENNPQDTDKRFSNVLDDIYHANLRSSYGFSDSISLGMHMNVSSKSNIKVDENLIFEQEAGLNDMFLNLKVKFMDFEHFRASFLLGLGYDVLQENPYIDRNRPFYYSSTVALMVDTQLIKWAVNAGYKYREIAFVPTLGEREIPPMSEKYFFSSGFSLGRDSTRILAEVSHSITSQRYRQQSDRIEEASETLIGVKFSTHSHSLTLANATEIKHGLSTSDNRLIIGYSYHPILEEPKAVVEVTSEPTQDSDSELIPEPIAEPDHEVEPESVPEPDFSSIFENIRFAEGASTILFDEKTRDAFAALKEYLRTKNPRAILVTGHTDNKGSHEFNLKLSLSRARAVKNHLRASGFSSTKILAIGMGSERPVADNTSKEGRRRNRRVEIKAYDKLILSH